MKAYRCLYFFWCLIFIICNSTFAKSSKCKFIGIVEYQYGNPIARIIMMKDSLRWGSLIEEGEAQKLDAHILIKKWDIFFNGRNMVGINNLKLREWKYYDEISTYEIIDTSNIAKIKINRNLFKTWLGIPKYRPLIMVSAPNPTSIKLITGSLLKIERNKLIKEFRSLIKVVFICDSITGPAKKYIYRNIDVEIPLVYIIPKLGRIIKMRVNHRLTKCDYNDYKYWSEIWLLLRDNGNITFLDPNISEDKALDLMVIDAGDYDNDGKIELLFSISLYNKGGYILFYNDCKESVNAMWGYH
jgi:hypothetical protein